MHLLRTSRIFSLTLTIMAVWSSACQERKANHVEPPREITIAQFGDFYLYAPLYIAIDNGYFKSKNLNVTLLNTGGDDKTWAAVLSGNAEFGVADPTFVAIAGSKGQPGRVIANLVNGVPFWGVTYRGDIPLITSPALLKPYTVATFPSPSTAYTLQSQMFRDAGLEPKIREGAFGTLLSLVQTGQADIALELEPNVSQAARDGAHVIYSMKDIYGPFAITGLTVAPSTIDSDKGLVEAVTCALQQSLDYIRLEPDGALQLLATRFPDLNREASRAALERVTREGIIPETLSTSPIAWSHAVDLRIKTGDLQPSQALSQYVVNSFAEAASASDGCRLRK